MVRLNKTPLPKQLLSDLFAQLYRTLGRRHETQVASLLRDLLGPEEQIMIAKRLAIMVMVDEGHSGYQIAQTLKVSKSTVEKVRNSMANESFNAIPLLKKDKTNYLAILDTIDTILHLGGTLPRYGQIHRTKHNESR